MPKKTQKLRVGVVGVPIYATPTWEYSSYDEEFRPTYTHKIRKKVVEHLKTLEKDLKKRGLELQVNDCGEITAGYSSIMDASQYEVKHEVTNELKKLDKKHDLLIVLGPNHTPAYSLYHFPGKVIRVDFHGDAAGGNAQVGGPTINYSTYFHHVLVEDKLKKPREVMSFGLGSKAHEGQAMAPKYLHPDMEKYLKKQVGRKDLHKVKAKTFDIDLDGLDLKYRTVTDALLGPEMEKDRKKASKGVLVSDLGRAIIRSGAKRIGIFEFSQMDENAAHMERTMKALSVAGVIGAASRKLKKKIRLKRILGRKIRK